MRCDVAVLLIVALGIAGCTGTPKSPAEDPGASQGGRVVTIPLAENVTIPAGACTGNTCVGSAPGVRHWIGVNGVIRWTGQIEATTADPLAIGPYEMTVAQAKTCGQACYESGANQSVAGGFPLRIDVDLPGSGVEGLLVTLQAAKPIPLPLSPTASPTVNATLTGFLTAALPDWKASTPGAGPSLRSSGAFPIWLVSQNADGTPANGISLQPSLNEDGSIIAFQSLATNLVDATIPECGDPSLLMYSCSQIYTVDLQTREVHLASTTPNGRPGSGDSQWPQINNAGTAVTFTSSATNLGASEGFRDVFLKRMDSGAISRTNLNSDGQPANIEEDPNDDFYGSRCALWCGGPSIAGKVDAVAFGSWSTNLAPNDGNRRPDVFVRDTQLSNTYLVSQTENGHFGNDASYTQSNGPYISDDGQRVAFSSVASNFADVPQRCESSSQMPLPYATAACIQVYVHDFATGQTILASRGPGGAGSEMSQAPVLSGDGRRVAFVTTAPEILGEPGNGRIQAVLKDLESGNIEVVSRTKEGNLWPSDVLWVTIDDDGDRVAFTAGQPIQRSTGGGPPENRGPSFGAFLWDERSDQVYVMSKDSGGQLSNHQALYVSLSGNGKWMAFDSDDSLADGVSSHQVYLVDVESALKNESGPRIPSTSAAFTIFCIILTATLCFPRQS